MRKFLVHYLIPVSVMEAWQKTDAATRGPAEEKVKAEWGRWMGEHASMFIATEAVGKTKRVSGDAVSDARNDIMAYSIIEADSHEAAAQAFTNNPHLQIPQSSIEVMEVRAFSLE